MKQGRYVAMAALILGAAVALLIWLSLREPRFEGAPLGLWMRIRQELEQAQDIHSFKLLLGALAEMGPAARPASPTVLRGITNFSLQSSRPVLKELRKIDP
jgi:hypothetical protein